jgi:hypothetical protein
MKNFVRKMRFFTLVHHPKLGFGYRPGLGKPLPLYIFPQNLGKFSKKIIMRNLYVLYGAESSRKDLIFWQGVCYSVSGGVYGNCSLIGRKSWITIFKSENINMIYIIPDIIIDTSSVISCATIRAQVEGSLLLYDQNQKFKSKLTSVEGRANPIAKAI